MTKKAIKHIENNDHLIKYLEDISDSTTQKRLNEWMLGHEKSHEEEAVRLLIFLQAWHTAKCVDIKDARAIRDSAIKSGITKRIEMHIRRGLQSQNNTPEQSLELLKWGLYGSNGGSPKDKEQSIFNCIMQKDFEHTIKDGKALPDNQMSNITPYSRKTIRKYRNRKDFILSLSLQIEAFEYIVQRSD